MVIHSVTEANRVRSISVAESRNQGLWTPCNHRKQYIATTYSSDGAQMVAFLCLQMNGCSFNGSDWLVVVCYGW
jgi:hypothetical protein